MPVVAGDGAHEGDPLLVLPGPRGVDPTVEQVLDEHVVHHRQARAAAGDQLVGVDPEQLGEHLAQLAQAVQPAVVAHVHAIGVLDSVRQAQELVGEVELGGAGLAPGEVEAQAALVQRGVCRALPPRGRPEFLGGALGEGGGRRLRWRCSPPYRGRARLGGAPHPGEFAPDRGRPVCLPFGVITILRHARGEGSHRARAPPDRGPRRAVAQLVELRSPKPAVGGSSPSCPASHVWFVHDCSP